MEDLSFLKSVPYEPEDKIKPPTPRVTVGAPKAVTPAPKEDLSFLKAVPYEPEGKKKEVQEDLSFLKSVPDERTDEDRVAAWDRLEQDVEWNAAVDRMADAAGEKFEGPNAFRQKLNWFKSDRRWKASNDVSQLREMGNTRFSDEDDRKAVGVLQNRWNDPERDNDPRDSTTGKVLEYMAKGAASPTNLIGAGIGAAARIAGVKVLSKFLPQLGLNAGVDMATGTGFNALEQSNEVATGERKEVDMGQAASAGALSAAAGAGANVLLSKGAAAVMGRDDPITPGAARAARTRVPDQSDTLRELTEIVPSAAGAVPTPNPATATPEPVLPTLKPGSLPAKPGPNLTAFELTEDIDANRRIFVAMDKAANHNVAARGNRVTDTQVVEGSKEFAPFVQAIVEARSASGGRGQPMAAEQSEAVMNYLARQRSDLDFYYDRAIAGTATPADKAAFRVALNNVRMGVFTADGNGAELGRALRRHQFYQKTLSSGDIKAIAGIAENVGTASPLNFKVGSEDGFDKLIAAYGKVRTDPVGLMAVARASEDPGFFKQMGEYWRANLLLNPTTHMVNLASNSAHLAAIAGEDVAASGIGQVRKQTMRMFGKKTDALSLNEAAARGYGMLAGTWDATKNFGRAMMDENFHVDQLEGRAPAIKGITGKIVRTPYRLLNAADSFFQTMARSGSLHQDALMIANREIAAGTLPQAQKTLRIRTLLAEPTPEMTKRAQAAGKHATFQDELGHFGKGAQSLAASNPAMMLVMPFVRTPTNVFKRSLERVPLIGLVMKENRDALIKGGIDADRVWAKQLTGAGIMATTWMAMDAGVMTSIGPTDPAQRRVWEDKFAPWSLRSENDDGTATNINMARMDPFSTTAQIIAIIHNSAKLLGINPTNDPNAFDKAANHAFGPDTKAVFQYLTQAVHDGVASKTMLSGVDNLLKAFTSEKGMQGYAESLVSSFVPAATLVRSIRRSVDPVMRDPGTIGAALKNTIPGMSEEVNPQRNTLGEVKTYEGGVVQKLLSPFYEKTDKNNPVINELVRINKGIPKPEDVVDGVKLSGKQMDEYTRAYGYYINEGAKALFSSPEYKQQAGGLADKTIQHNMVDAAVIGPARELTKMHMRTTFPELGRLMNQSTFDTTVKQPTNKTEAWRERTFQQSRNPQVPLKRNPPWPGSE